jgi:DNA (cytosine-5)-methyltransferase 1
MQSVLEESAGECAWVMNELSLFSGAGGGLLGTKLLGFRCVGYVENDAYCQAVLKARIQDGVLDDAPIFGDIRDFLRSGAAECYRGVADVVTAGFPCPKFSQAAHSRNIARDWCPEVIECLRIVRPRYALLENVAPFVYRGLKEMLADLAILGFDAEWAVFSAAASGAPHIRKRLFVLAGDTDRNREPNCEVNAKAPWLSRMEWMDRPGKLRVGDGLAPWMDRLRAAGNGQVPIVAARAWSELMKRMEG